MDETDTAGVGSGQADQKDLATFGYKQELHRTLGFFSSFAAAFSYISPSTGIFTLFFLGLTTIGGVFFWSWPIVAIGQMLVALNFAEVSSHFPIAGSVSSGRSTSRVDPSRGSRDGSTSLPASSR